jgi:triacylglycerol esterase/lipase EstA (alpha/beta hydrolase family)
MKQRFVAFVSAIALCVVGAAFTPASSMAHDPILFVHGWSESASLWNTMIGRFEKDGYSKSELSAYSYNTSQSNKIDAEKEVASHVESLLNTRWYIKFDGGESKVDDWVSLGGPNHGTETANACAFQVACQEMEVGSKFLSELNAGDETPGTVNYGTWWSPCDEIINPDESVILSGASNHKTACMSHTALTTNETVYKEVREFVK